MINKIPLVSELFWFAFDTEQKQCRRASMKTALPSTCISFEFHTVHIFCWTQFRLRRKTKIIIFFLPPLLQTYVWCPETSLYMHNRDHAVCLSHSNSLKYDKIGSNLLNNKNCWTDDNMSEMVVIIYVGISRLEKVP